MMVFQLADLSVKFRAIRLPSALSTMTTMKSVPLFLAAQILSFCVSTTQAADSQSVPPHADIASVQKTIIAIENSILDRWDSGDPMGFVDVSADDVTYFGPEMGRRIDGKKAFRDRLTPLIGKIHNPPRRMENPMVRVFGEIALLTFVDVYDFPNSKSIWNVTEVYRLEGNEWKLIHSQWSEAKEQ
jgi:hypothetical protein